MLSTVTLSLVSHNELSDVYTFRAFLDECALASFHYSFAHQELVFQWDDFNLIDDACNAESCVNALSLSARMIEHAAQLAFAMHA